MSCKELRSRRSLDVAPNSLHACQRSNSSSSDMEVDFGSNKLSATKKPIWGKAMCEIEESTSPRCDQLMNNRRDWDPDGEVHRSTSPLNDEHLAPKKKIDGYRMPVGVSAKHEDSSGTGNAAGLLRLSGKKGWTASSWKNGSGKSQMVVPGNLHDMQRSQDDHGAPRTPRGSGGGLDHPLSATRSNMVSVEHGLTRPAGRSTTGREEHSRVSPGGNSKHSKEWINMELERLRSEYQFKSQIATMLRSTLAGMKTQQMEVQPQRAQDWRAPSRHQHDFPPQESPRSIINQVPNREWSAPLTEASSGELEAMKSEAKKRNKDISDLEAHILTLETHVKLLSDALDDERQENQDLSEENDILKAQVERLTAAGEKLLKGMTAMRGVQE